MNLKELSKLGALKIWSNYKDQQRKEHKLTYLFWECTLNCNFFCKHCGSSAGRKNYEGSLKTEEIKNVFEEVADNFNPKETMIAVTGGEPLLRQDLFDVMKYAKSLGFSWGMVTNGFLVNEKILQKMKDSGMDTIVVSIDGIEKTHDEFRQVKGAYEHAIKAIKLLDKANFLKDLQITTCIHKGNFADLEKMYKTFIPLGITSWRVMNVDPIGRAEDNSEIIINDSQLKLMLEFIKEKRKTSKVKITYGCEGFLGLDFEDEVRGHLFYCATGINIASILYNGDIFICPNVPRLPHLIQGNVKKDSFVKIWNEKFEFFRNKNRTNCDKCSKCKFWDFCLGGSFHLWDFKKNKPKLCHVQILGDL